MAAARIFLDSSHSSVPEGSPVAMSPWSAPVAVVPASSPVALTAGSFYVALTPGSACVLPLPGVPLADARLPRVEALLRGMATRWPGKISEEIQGKKIKVSFFNKQRTRPVASRER